MQLNIPNVFTNGTEEVNIIDAPKVNADFNAVAYILNGNIEHDNIKAGAKILVSDRDYTGGNKIIGTFEFNTFPTVPDASIPDAKLSSNAMLKSAYDADLDGQVEDADHADTADDADTVDGQHASDLAAADHNHDGVYAPITEGVTNGNSHDHSAGDGALIPEGGLSLSDVITGDVDITRHGFVPKAPDDVGKFLRGDGVWAAGLGNLWPRRWGGFRADGAGFASLMATLTTGGDPGTLFDVSDDISNWTSIQINAGSGSKGYVYTSGGVRVRRAYLFDVTIRIQTPVSKPNFRLWAGLTDAHFTDNADDPASRHLAMFRWSYNVGGGANWYAVTKDGTTINAQDTGVAFTADSEYVLRIWAEAGKVCFTINGGNKIELTSNLPGSSTPLLLELVAVSNDGSSGWVIRVGSAFVEFNG